MAEWLATYDAASSPLIFTIWLLLAQRGQVLTYQSIDLGTADLFQSAIKGSVDRPLLLHDVSFNGTRLEQVTFDYVHFTRCDFTDAKVWQGEFQHCGFSDCEFERADLTATTWRLNDLTELLLGADCGLAHSQWVRNRGQALRPGISAPDLRTDQQIPEDIWLSLIHI